MNRRYLRWLIVMLLIGAVAGIIWYLTRPEPVEVVLKSVDRGMVERTVANTRAGTVLADRLLSLPFARAIG